MTASPGHHHEAPRREDLRRAPEPLLTPRRRAVLLGGALGVVGLSGAAAWSVLGRPLDDRGPAPTGTTPPPSTTPPAAPSTPPAAPPPAVLADVTAYTVLPGEVEPDCKRAAVAFVTTVLTTGTPTAGSTPLAARLAPLGVGPAAAAEPLLDLLPAAGASALEVVYPQYGGLVLERDEASVMLVADQLLLPTASEQVLRRSITVDVRLRRQDGAWQVTQVLPATPAPEQEDLSPPAEQLLGTDRVLLPAAARADLLSGQVQDGVCEALLQLAERWTVSVAVLSSGHPTDVFGTDRVSNHTRGRAADVWAIDGVPVIDRTRAAWRELMTAGRAAGASEVGGPQDPGGPGFFTDQVHQDHVHLGFGVIPGVGGPGSEARQPDVSGP